ncbi:MAG: macrolide family glycosyltransferase [Sarcina sp.]
MKKILIVNFPGHGHVNPTIKLVKELKAAGNEIVYYCTEEFREKLEKVGAIYKSYLYEPVVEKDSRGNKEILLRNAINLTDAVLGSVLKEEKDFDILIYDSVLSIGEDIKEKLSIKESCALYTTFALSKNMMNKARSAGQSSPVFLESSSDLFKEKTKGINEKYGIKLKSMLEAMTDSKADKNIVFTSRHFQPLENDFDKSFIFVGPSVTERGELTEFNLEKNEDKKLLYISLGTIDNKRLDFYKITFEAFGKADKIDVVLSVGKNTNIENLGKIPSNFKVFNYVPQLEVLKKADIFITHGGMNSSSEGLYNNIPLVVVPQFGDQFLVGRTVSALGAGVMVSKDNLNAINLREAVGQIISNDDFERNAEKIGVSLREATKNLENLVKEISK